MFRTLVVVVVVVAQGCYISRRRPPPPLRPDSDPENLLLWEGPPRESMGRER